MAKYGVVYLAMGPAYAVLAGLSIKTLKKFSDIPVTVIVDDSVKFHSESLGADTIKCISNLVSENRTIKSRIYEMSPYENTLFIDCDTIINGDVAGCFHYLEYFDIAIKQRTKAFSRLGKGSLTLFNGKHIVSELPHWNSGVIVFKRNKKTKKCFKIGRNYSQNSNIILTNQRLRRQLSGVKLEWFLWRKLGTFKIAEQFMKVRRK